LLHLPLSQIYRIKAKTQLDRGSDPVKIDPIAVVLLRCELAWVVAKQAAIRTNSGPVDYNEESNHALQIKNSSNFVDVLISTYVITSFNY